MLWKPDLSIWILLVTVIQDRKTPVNLQRFMLNLTTPKHGFMPTAQTRDLDKSVTVCNGTHIALLCPRSQGQVLTRISSVTPGSLIVHVAEALSVMTSATLTYTACLHKPSVTHKHCAYGLCPVYPLRSG